MNDLTASGQTDKTPRRVLITGSRDWTDEQAIRAALANITMWHGAEIVVVHGACPTGADAIADRVARDWGGGMTVERHPADWNAHGKAAGPLRNKHMVSLGADVCLAFPQGESRGTRHCMSEARAAGIPVVVSEVSGG